jgi:hypothetical protein
MGILEDAAKNWVLARDAFLSAPVDDPDYRARYARLSELRDAEDFLARMVRALVISPDNHLGPL